MSASCVSMEEEWRKRIQASPDAKDARKNLEFHRTKMEELQEELREAETYEAELEGRLKQVEDRLKPPVMRFQEKLNQDSGVNTTLVEEVIEEVEDPSQIITLMKTRANMMDQMTRSQLVGFIRTILNLRDSFTEQEIEAGTEVMTVSASILISSPLLYNLFRKWPRVFSIISAVQPSTGPSCLTGKPRCSSSWSGRWRGSRPSWRGSWTPSCPRPSGLRRGAGTTRTWN